LTGASAKFRPLAWLVLLALAGCGATLVSGMAVALVYTDSEPALRSFGLTAQHLRPLHESFALAWMFLGGVSVVYLYLFRTFGPPPSSVRRRFFGHLVLWTIAGSGILVTLLLGRFTGREYLGYHPAFSALILLGWLLFAWNYFSWGGISLKGRPVYIYMWSVGIPLFVITYLEGHLYLLEAVSSRPVRDIAIQWRGTGILVGSFNLLAYGSLMYVASCIRGNERYAHSRTAFALFCVGVLNTFTNYGHHTFHLPQSAWIHWISFIVSMLETIILAKVFLDFLATRRGAAATDDLRCSDRFIRSGTLWTLLMLLLAVMISLPPLNALIHGTHVVVAHSMGSMIGIDSMILWAALSYLLGHLVRPGHPAVQGTRVRAAIPFISVFLLVFLIAFLARGIAAGMLRYLGPSSPDVSLLVKAFPTVMFVSGFGLAASILWILAHWMIALGHSMWRET